MVDSDKKDVDDDNQLLGRINGTPRYGIALYVTPTKKRRKKRDGTETQYFIQCECKVYQNKMTRMCWNFADTDAVKIKCGSATLRQTIPILHSMCIAHMTFSDKYIRIKSYFYIYFIFHQCSTIVDTSLMFFLCSLQYVLYMQSIKKNTPQLRLMPTSIEGKVR